eukprot:gene168-981_t
MPVHLPKPEKVVSSLSAEFDEVISFKKQSAERIQIEIDEWVKVLEDAKEAFGGLDDNADADAVNDLLGSVTTKIGGSKVPENVKKHCDESWKQLAKLGKSVEKQLCPDLGVVLKDLLVQVHLDEAVINDGIAQHLLHTAQFDTYKSFVDELKEEKIYWPESPKAASMERGCRDLHTITKALMNHDVQPALAWFESLPTELRDIHSNVAFGMHSLQFMAILHNSKGDATEALAYARENFERFEGKRASEIARLMGAIAFCGHLEDSPYDEFTHESVWEEMTESFRKVYCDGSKFLNDKDFALAAAPESGVSKILQRERPGSPRRRHAASSHSSRYDLLACTTPEPTNLKPFEQVSMKFLRSPHLPNVAQDLLPPQHPLQEQLSEHGYAAVGGSSRAPGSMFRPKDQARARAERQAIEPQRARLMQHFLTGGEGQSLVDAVRDFESQVSQLQVLIPQDHQVQGQRPNRPPAPASSVIATTTTTAAISSASDPVPRVNNINRPVVMRLTVDTSTRRNIAPRDNSSPLLIAPDSPRIIRRDSPGTPASMANWIIRRVPHMVSPSMTLRSDQSAEGVVRLVDRNISDEFRESAELELENRFPEQAAIPEDSEITLSINETFGTSSNNDDNSPLSQVFSPLLGRSVAAAAPRRQAPQQQSSQDAEVNVIAATAATVTSAEEPTAAVNSDSDNNINHSAEGGGDRVPWDNLGPEILDSNQDDGVEEESASSVPAPFPSPIAIPQTGPSLPPTASSQTANSSLVQSTPPPSLQPYVIPSEEADWQRRSEREERRRQRERPVGFDYRRDGELLLRPDDVNSSDSAGSSPFTSSVNWARSPRIAEVDDDGDDYSQAGSDASTGNSTPAHHYVTPSSGPSSARSRSRRVAAEPQQQPTPGSPRLRAAAQEPAPSPPPLIRGNNEESAMISEDNMAAVFNHPNTELPYAPQELVAPDFST